MPFGSGGFVDPSNRFHDDGGFIDIDHMVAVLCDSQATIGR
jgi:hypothetical protein